MIRFALATAERSYAQRKTPPLSRPTDLNSWRTKCVIEI